MKEVKVINKLMSKLNEVLYQSRKAIWDYYTLRIKHNAFTRIMRVSDSTLRIIAGDTIEDPKEAKKVMCLMDRYQAYVISLDPPFPIRACEFESFIAQLNYDTFMENMDDVPEVRKKIYTGQKPLFKEKLETA